MANRREKMDRAARAKQFMPFDALKGFREALKEKEDISATQKDSQQKDFQYRFTDSRY